MVETLTRHTLRTLLTPRSGPCLTVMLPTHRFGPETEQDKARLKNLLREAERLSREASDDEAAVEPIAAVRTAASDPGFWREMHEGLAIFSAPGLLTFLRTTVPLPERVEVGDRLVVAPLVAALPPVERFFVIALSINGARAIEATPDTTRRLEVPGLPAGMEQALGYEQFDTTLQAHSAGPRALGRSAAMFHGHGDADEERLRRDLAAYFRQVAAALRSLPSGVPRVLATVESQASLYREVSGDPDLVSEIVPGNFDSTADGELAARARPLVELEAAARVEASLARYRELGDRHRVSADPAGIVAAADQGRVDTLFVDAAHARWGRYEATAAQVALHDARQPGDDDLVDLAVTRTLAQGGEVVPLPPGGAGTGMAAILRY